MLYYRFRLIEISRVADMTTDLDLPGLCFVWRPADITSSVIEMARRTGTKVIFDLTAVEPFSVGGALLQADASGDAVDLKISQTALMEAGLEGFLNELNINRVWVELHPMLLETDARDLLGRIAQLSSRMSVIPVVGDCGLIAQVLNEYPIPAIALKGSEASGFVGSETAFTLYAVIDRKSVV